MQAQQRAEEISSECGTKVNIVGWYHSHPKITVVPSNVGENPLSNFFETYPQIYPNFISQQNNYRSKNSVWLSTNG